MKNEKTVTKKAAKATKKAAQIMTITPEQLAKAIKAAPAKKASLVNAIEKAITKVKIAPGISMDIVEAPLGNAKGITVGGKKIAAPKATKKAKKASKKAAKEAPAADVLSIHINKTGRICFGKAAAERIGDLAYMIATQNGKAIKLVAQAKKAEGALDINRANGRPYVSATKLLKATGGFDGTQALDIEAKAINGTGFSFEVA